MDLENGKQIFFKYYGNHFSIDRECPKEYKKCKVPKEYEIEWLEEIQKELYQTLCNTKGEKRFSTFLILSDIIPLTDAIELTCKLLNSNLDYFERLLYTEYLKQLNRRAKKSELEQIIDENKQILKRNINFVKRDSKKIHIYINENGIEERINNL